MAINICGGAHIAMSEPFLDLLHGHALCEEHRGAGVAKIVEADLLQIMLLQQLPEVSGDEVGIVQLAECVTFSFMSAAKRQFHIYNIFNVDNTNYFLSKRVNILSAFSFGAFSIPIIFR